MNHRLNKFVALFAVALALSGCGVAAKPPAPAAKADIPVGTQVGNLAPNFKMNADDGSDFALSSTKGKTTTLVFLSAQGCSGCIAEAQALNTVKRSYGDALQVVAVDVSGAPKSALDAFKPAAGNPAFTWLRNDQGEISKLYRVAALDTTFVLDREGKIVFHDEESTTADTFKQVLAQLKP